VGDESVFGEERGGDVGGARRRVEGEDVVGAFHCIGAAPVVAEPFTDA